MTHKVILVYEHIPEDTWVYELDLDTEEYEKIRKCHNRFVNINDNEETIWLSMWLEDKKPVFKSKDEGDRPIIVPVIDGFNEVTVIVTGFVM